MVPKSTQAKAVITAALACVPVYEITGFCYGSSYNITKEFKLFKPCIFCKLPVISWFC
jgi:hypothetical protein